MAANSRDAFIELDSMPSDDESGSRKSSTPTLAGVPLNDVTAAVGQQVAASVLNAGKEKAQALVTSYARLDILRPYFDVEPRDVTTRLLQSLWPKFTRQPQPIGADLYGPLMLALTLAAVLLMGMKSSGHQASPESTLIGSALALSFGYWISLSGVVYALGFIFNCNITATELFATTGYSLFAYCVALTASHILPSSHHDFLIAWLALGTLASLRMGLLLRSRTPDAKQGFLVCIAVIGVHWTYLLYLNFAYVTIAKSLV